MQTKLKNIMNGPIVTEVLVALNVIYFVILTIDGGSTNVSVLVTHGALVPEWVKNGEMLQTIFTAMFVHIGFEHILFNMLTLYFIGRLLEVVIGHLRFLGIYLFAGIFGNIVSLVFSNPYSISAGASGAIFGIVGVWIMLAEQYRSSPVFVSMGRQMIVFTILGLISGMVGGGINIFAHLGGLVAGFLGSYVIGFKRLGSVPFAKRSASGIILIIMLIIFSKLAFTW